MPFFQVTLTAVATPIVAQNATQNSTQLRIAFQQLQIQNNATHGCRVGGPDVSATKGFALASGSTTPTAPFVASCHQQYSSDLSEYYVFGTVGDVIDVFYLV